MSDVAGRQSHLSLVAKELTIGEGHINAYAAEQEANSTLSDKFLIYRLYNLFRVYHRSPALGFTQIAIPACPIRPI